MLDAKNSLANPNADPISLILNKDGRTAAEVASLGTLDDADRAAEKQ